MSDKPIVFTSQMSNLLIEDYILLSIVYCILFFNDNIVISRIQVSSKFAIIISDTISNEIFRDLSNLDLIV